MNTAEIIKDHYGTEMKTQPNFGWTLMKECTTTYAHQSIEVVSK